jgi:hypothetical protein
MKLTRKICEDNEKGAIPSVASVLDSETKMIPVRAQAGHWTARSATQGEGWPGLAGPARTVSAQQSPGIKNFSSIFQTFY